MSTLYELEDSIKELLELLEEEPDSDVVKDTLEALNYEFDEKAEGYCKAIRTCELRLLSIKDEKKRLDELRASTEKAIERMKLALKTAMINTDRKKVTTELFTISVRNTPLSLDSIPPISKIPERYLIPQEPTLNKRLLLEDIKAGISIEGVSTKQGTSISIK